MNYPLICKIVFSCFFMHFVIVKVAAQEKQPPIPAELFFGNKQLFFQATIKKKFTPTSKFSFFGLTTYTASYNNKLSDNRLVSEVQISYNFKKGFGFMAGTDVNSATGFFPVVGPQYTYASKKIVAVTIASFFLNSKNDFKIFGLYEYKPAIGKKLVFYNRLQFIYNLSIETGNHNRSFLYLRSGLKQGPFAAGIAANLDQFGPTKIFKENYGLFVRWEFE